jgi:hypothetical protein
MWQVEQRTCVIQEGHPMRRTNGTNSVMGALALLASTLSAVAAESADTSFCGRPTGEPAALMETISKDAGVKEIHRGPEYIAYQDTTSQAVFTFSQAAQGPAHPAAICRKPVKEGDSMVLQMVIVCKGDGTACQRLNSDFKLLNAQMEAAIRNESGQPAPTK